MVAMRSWYTAYMVAVEYSRSAYRKTLAGIGAFAALILGFFSLLFVSSPRSLLGETEGSGVAHADAPTLYNQASYYSQARYDTYSQSTYYSQATYGCGLGACESCSACNSCGDGGDAGDGCGCDADGGCDAP